MNRRTLTKYLALFPFLGLTRLQASGKIVKVDDLYSRLKAKETSNCLVKKIYSVKPTESDYDHCPHMRNLDINYRCYYDKDKVTIWLNKDGAQMASKWIDLILKNGLNGIAYVDQYDNVGFASWFTRSTV